MTKTEIVKSYMRCTNLKSLTLAKKIFHERPDYFMSIEEIRGIIRRLRGSNGNKRLLRTSDEFLTPENRAKKYNLPPSILNDYTPFKITADKALIFGDVHIPFHSVDALHCMFDNTANGDYDYIILNGDIIDMYDISDFDKEPGISKIKDEIASCKQFLSTLKIVYPKSKIIYKYGNHEKRLSRYINVKAPELYGLNEVRLDNLLDLFNQGIQYIEDDRYIDINGLSLFHGHEIKFGGKDPAYALYQKVKVSAACNHFHRESKYTETRLGKEQDSCWTIGCMCDLHPKYIPHNNQWVHGFAEFERIDENYWHLHNRTIMNGRIV